MGLLTKVSFPQCLFSPVGHRSRATRNTRKMLCTLSAAKHDQAGSACWRCCIFESLLFELLEVRERGRPPQAALSLIQVPGRFQNHVAGEQREGALTDAVTSQFSGGQGQRLLQPTTRRLGLFPHQTPHRSLGLANFRVALGTTVHSHHSRELCVGDGGSLRASLPFSPQLAIFGRPTCHQRASTPGFKQLSTTSPSRCIRSSTVSSTAGKTATPHDQVGQQLHTIAAISLHSHHHPRGPNSDPSTEEHGPTSAS